ncbi:MAG: glycosyltransferase family 4 protein [Bacteroidales bacterium]|nr:glycosyltransferase family 4 protein [Bacteroidales bacterium]
MKVCIIANDFQEEYTVNLINSMIDYGIDVDFIGSGIYPLQKINKKVNFLNLRGDCNPSDNTIILKKAVRMLRYYLRLIIYISKTKTKLIHIQWYRFAFTEGILISLYMKMCGKKLVYTVHNVLPHDRWNLINQTLFWIIYRIHNKIIVHTEYIKLQLVNKFGIRPEKIVKVIHGLYEVKIRTLKDRVSAREHFSFHPNDFVLLFFGIIRKYKGLDFLLDVFEELTMNAGFKIIVAGKVSDSYKSEMKTLQLLHSSGNIKFILRHINNNEIDQIFNASDVTVLPYTEASQSGVMLLSYAYGKPVIAPKLGGFPEDVIEGKNGYLFEPGNAESLKAKIKLLRSVWLENSKKMSSEIRQTANKTYSWNKSISKLNEVYQSFEK